MSTRIYKYVLATTLLPGKLSIPMPRQATIISFGVDGSHQMCVWAVVNPSSPAVLKRIKVCYTGEDSPAAERFIGTYIDPRDGLVYHCFDCGWVGEPVGV